MNALLTSAVLALFAPAADEQSPTTGAEQPKKQTSIPVNKETTHVLGPLDKDGFVDFEAALNEKLGKGITPEKNANVLLWKALGPRPEGGKGMPAGFFKWLGIKEPPEEGEYFVSMYRYAKDDLKIEPSGEEMTALFDEQSRAGKLPWSARDLPRMAQWLKLNEKPLGIVIEATKRPDYYNPLVSTKGPKGSGGLIGALLPNVQKCREIASALTARAMLRVGEGKVDEAWQDLLACHRLGRLMVRGGATLIESLVGIAIDAIASNAEIAFLDRGKLTTKQVQACLRDLQALPALPNMADKIDVGERFMMLDSVMLIRRGGLETLGGLAGELPKKDDPVAKKAMEVIDWGLIMRNGNTWYDRLSGSMRIKDRAAREKAIDQIETDLAKLAKRGPNLVQALLAKGKDPGKAVSQSIGDVLMGLLLPAVRKVGSAFDRAEQFQRNQHVAFALGAYRRDNGRYPEKLEDLAPKYLAKVPDDLFTGKPLAYRPAKDGYLLYSFGPNGKDDEGRWLDDDPRGDDPRVRMPVPDPKKK